MLAQHPPDLGCCYCSKEGNFVARFTHESSSSSRVDFHSHFDLVDTRSSILGPCLTDSVFGQPE